ASVSVSIHDTTAATYWNGSSWASDSSGEVYNTATGTTSWTLALAASQLTSGDSFTVHAKSTDGATNVSTVASQTFTYNAAGAASGGSVIGSGTLATNAATVPVTLTAGAAVGSTVFIVAGEKTVQTTGSFSAADNLGVHNTFVVDKDSPNASGARVAILRATVTSALSAGS